MKRIRILLLLIIMIVVTSSSSFSLQVFADDTNCYRNTPKGQATVEMWNLTQRYADPNYFKGSYYRSKVEYYESMGKLSGSGYKIIASDAKRVTAGCKTDYQKMEAIARYIATRTYYDYPCYMGKTKSTNYSAYSVWKNKRTVCQGYSNLYYAMLYSLNIPCMFVLGNNHVFSAAYDRSSRRWVFTDVCWASKNRITADGRWHTGEYNPKYFDMSLDFILSLSSHEILSVEGVQVSNVYYEMSHGCRGTGVSNLINRKTWHWKTTCQNKRKSTLKITSKIGKYKVTEIGYDSFYDCPHIKKVILPTTITKVGKFSFCLKNNKKRVKTTIVTKLSKSKLRLKKNYSWWGRKTKVRKK